MADHGVPPAPVEVLICDDVTLLRTMLRAVIERRDLRRDGEPVLRVVGEACDGDEAIREAARLQPDVILLDLTMPIRTGFDALPEIKQVAPSAKVIVLSSVDASLVAKDLLARGADRYLEKSADPKTIADAVAAVALG
jgi:DNA-binding NarL/FixJ family response regulator